MKYFYIIFTDGYVLNDISELLSNRLDGIIILGDFIKKKTVDFSHLNEILIFHEVKKDPVNYQ